MKVRLSLIFLFSISLLICISACDKKPTKPSGEVALTKETDAASSGIGWSYPGKWIKQAPRQMRIATYHVTPVAGDTDGGECAVFYFGDSQGGSVDANIDRWASQFEGAGAPLRASKDVAGMKITTVHITGTYLAPSGPMMESSGKKENYSLLGAIIEGPQGPVFFKFTGPGNTVHSAEGEFDAMIGSFTK